MSLLQKVVYMDSKLYSCSMTNPALPSDPPKSFTFDGVRYGALVGKKTQYFALIGPQSEYSALIGPGDGPEDL